VPCGTHILRSPLEIDLLDAIHIKIGVNVYDVQVFLGGLELSKQKLSLRLEPSRDWHSIPLLADDLLFGEDLEYLRLLHCQKDSSIIY
jgi:hypothetical protein